MTTLTNYKQTKEEFDEYYDNFLDNWLFQQKLNIDATHRCMLACAFCNRTILKWGMEQVKDHRRIYGDLTVQDAVRLGNIFTTQMFCGNISDPIYNPQFLEILEALGDTTTQCIQIHTNGSHKTSEWWHKLVDICNNQKYFTEIIFGIDGIDQKTALHRVNQNFDESWYAMKYCKENLDPSKSSVVWQFIPFKYNQHEIEKAKELAKDLKVKFMILKSGRFGFENSPLDPPDDKNLYSTGIISNRETTDYEKN
jgi:MoaA/NifB/PqqE/SkfB family radical SAM enzyme